MIRRHALVRALLGLLATAGLTLSQDSASSNELAEPDGDPETPTPPTKAYREAVRTKGIGVKVGEIGPTGAILWARVPPADEVHFLRKRDFVAWFKSLFVEADLQVRMKYGLLADASDGAWSGWSGVGEQSDFTAHWPLGDLRPGREYFYQVEGSDEGLRSVHEPRTGRFRTAPKPSASQTVSFTVVGCQRYDRLDDPNGYAIYKSMERLNPDFTVLTGDTVYLDRGPVKARSIELARDRWRRVYELPYLFEYHARVPAYWQKEDHDLLRDEAGPASPPLGELTFEDGLKVFRDHTPVGDVPYRSFRWGSLAEVWLLEGREFRDSNAAPDGPNKSLLGSAQKAWLKSTLAASDASWRILITPTPIVGPDRARFKRDNLSNSAWENESAELRSFFAEELGDNFFIITGDRHWQYCSVDPQGSVEEFCCGPATDAHAGGSPGRDRHYHRFHRVLGGFLSVSVGREDGSDYAVVRLHSVEGQVVFEDRKTRPVRT
ncbi:MAG: alkaline phosphatase D family protein [Acidobacteria bacterium]|nr:alkaline phosphatase D family protein [Acidobacteriota bacterium]